ncbi:MAG TPA: ABC transporter substrate-binding protein [Aggregatilineaceae bacterium]|nr:ABC transporter substrate-binding protein [Aggregatilineaceae bacterium]
MSVKRVLLFVLTLMLVSALVVPALPAAKAQDGSKYGESPLLAEKVAAGELPPVEERLPENPRVVPLAEGDTIGVYGGIWNRAWRGVNDFHCFGRLVYDPVLRWPADPANPVEPGLAEKWEWNADGTELTLFFRKGLKWSDGEPFTVDDVIFWWEAIETDTNVTKAVHAEWKTMTELVKVDDSTITLKFSAPNGLAETVGLAFHGNQWPLGFERFGFYAPKHYLEQFHPAYNADATYEQFEEAVFDYNVERPVMTAWKISQYDPGATLMVAERNPYYWAVDEEGNQLPYIDQIYFHLVEDVAGVNVMGVAGQIDMQDRAIALDQYPVYIENSEANNYHMLLWPQAMASNATFWFNMSYSDAKYRELFQTFDFRRAMSLAIDRNTINELVFLGQGVPRTETVVPDSPYYQPEIEAVNSEYDPATAESLLDGLGLVKGDDGFRTFSDGSELLIVITTSGTGAGELQSAELVTEWWNAIGIKTELKQETRDVFWAAAGANENMVSTWTTDRGLVPMVDPIYQFPFDERSWMAPAYGMWYKTDGAEGEEPTAEFKAIMDLYNEYKVTTDPAKQLEIGKQIVKNATEQLWTIGTVGLVPTPVVVKNNFMNVSEHHTADWIIMTPGTQSPSHFYFADGGQ